MERDDVQGNAGLSLLFARGERPSASDLGLLLSTGSLAKRSPRILERPGSDVPAAPTSPVELLIDGLIFDISGLSPGPAVAPPTITHQFGMTVDPAQFDFEGVSIAPGPHIAGGGAMMPVVRTIAALGSNLARALAVKAVCWHPAGIWMEPGYFCRAIDKWFADGDFPALGLTAVTTGTKGSVESAGLAFFSGQEVRVEGTAGEPRGDTVQLAVRVINHIIEHGPLTALRELDGPSGETLLAEPTHDGRRVQVWRAPL